MSIFKKVNSKVNNYIERLEKKERVRNIIEKDGAKETWQFLKKHKVKFVPLFAFSVPGKVAAGVILAGIFVYYKFRKKTEPV